VCILGNMQRTQKVTKKIPQTAFVLFVMGLIVLMASFSGFGVLPSTNKAYADDPTPTVAVQKSLTYRGSVNASGLFNGAGLSLTLPNTIQPGDLLIAVAGTNGPVSSWVAPTGWTQGQNSGSSDAEGLTWWWKIADGTEAGTSITLQSSSYADGGAVVNVYAGEAANAIAGVSSLTTNDNFGNGHVTSANVGSVSLDNTVTAVPLILASWQPNMTTVSFPEGFGFESAADDGYSFVAVGEAYSSLTTNNFPGYSVSFFPGQAVVQTLQVLVNVQ